MISWMQKNNKFLIVTIWIATISFIFTGATYGFSFGVKSNSIGQVGSIELGRDRFQMEYQNIYSRYNQMFQGKFDEEQFNLSKEQLINAVKQSQSDPDTHKVLLHRFGRARCLQSPLQPGASRTPCHENRSRLAVQPAGRCRTPQRRAARDRRRV